MSVLLFETECGAFRDLCYEIATPFAYKALRLLEAGDLVALTQMAAEPGTYTCAKTYLGDRQIATFFKKFQDFDSGADRKAAAVKTFEKAEAECYQTNERLNPLLTDASWYGEGVKQLFAAWRKEIKRVIGSRPRLSGNGKFGPGSTLHNVGDDITIAHKLSENYTRTESMAPFLHLWDTTAWSRYAACDLDSVGDNFVAQIEGVPFYHNGEHAPRDFEVVRGNRFTSVSKTATTDRGICIEPSLNVFYQLMLGGEISSCMRRRLGWEKKSCQQFHKVLAWLGSLTGAVSTIDLSNASDTICRILVQLLLPRLWYESLDACRSKYTFIGGKWRKLEKFSSMGNGFTFELETLLFFTLSRVVADLVGVDEDPFTPGLTVSCYGDDIVVPTSISAVLIKALKFAGFTTNVQKTFVKGPFRESCGGDYWKGSDVRPFYLMEKVNDPAKTISLANGIRRFRLRYGQLAGHFNVGRSAWSATIARLPVNIRVLRGPEALGDLVINDWEDCWLKTNPIVLRNSIRYLKVWRPVANDKVSWDHFRPGVVLASALYGVPSGTPPLSDDLANSTEMWRRSGVVRRVNGSYVKGHRFGRVAYS